MGKLGEVLAHPTELWPLIQMFGQARRITQLPKDPDLAFCYGLLNDVSRSFAMVIQQLPNPLRDAICVFYLVLRGLDTVEDDMSLDPEYKVKELRTFHTKLYDRSFNMTNCGQKHYKRLMLEFQRVNSVFLSQERGFQEVIEDITKRMGHGMADFIDKQEVKSVAEYNKYCHYVAGLVGIGLSQLFASSLLEGAEVQRAEGLANHMGLFLQKTNIIRDYLEDIMEEPAPRMFWPHEIWSRYAATLADLKDPQHRPAAVQCLNHMVCDALTHLPHCLEYMALLRDTSVFRFCAIPQIMAIGTLALCYNNGKVFQGVVKMRRGQTAKVFQTCGDMGNLHQWFTHFLDVLHAKVDTQVDAGDPTLGKMRSAVASYQDLCHKGRSKWLALHPSDASVVSWLRDYWLLSLTGVYAYHAWGLGPSPSPAASLSPQAPLHELMARLSEALRTHPHVHRLVATVLLVLMLLVVVYKR